MRVRRLLYVEDNEDNLYMLQLWFDVLGEYEILSARDGAAGIAMAAKMPMIATTIINSIRVKPF